MPKPWGKRPREVVPPFLWTERQEAREAKRRARLAQKGVTPWVLPPETPAGEAPLPPPRAPIPLDIEEMTPEEEAKWEKELEQAGEEIELRQLAEREASWRRFPRHAPPWFQEQLRREEAGEEEPPEEVFEWAPPPKRPPFIPSEYEQLQAKLDHVRRIYQTRVTPASRRDYWAQLKSRDRALHEGAEILSKLYKRKFSPDDVLRTDWGRTLSPSYVPPPARPEARPPPPIEPPDVAGLAEQLTVLVKKRGKGKKLVRIPFEVSKRKACKTFITFLPRSFSEVRQAAKERAELLAERRLKKNELTKVYQRATGVTGARKPTRFSPSSFMGTLKDTFEGKKSTDKKVLWSISGSHDVLNPRRTYELECKEQRITPMVEGGRTKRKIRWARVHHLVPTSAVEAFDFLWAKYWQCSSDGAFEALGYPPHHPESNTLVALRMLAFAVGEPVDVRTARLVTGYSRGGKRGIRLNTVQELKSRGYGRVTGLRRSREIERELLKKQLRREVDLRAGTQFGMRRGSRQHFVPPQDYYDLLCGTRGKRLCHLGEQFHQQREWAQWRGTKPAVTCDNIVNLIKAELKAKRQYEREEKRGEQLKGLTQELRELDVTALEPHELDETLEALARKYGRSLEEVAQRFAIDPELLAMPPAERQAELVRRVERAKEQFATATMTPFTRRAGIKRKMRLVRELGKWARKFPSSPVEDFWKAVGQWARDNELVPDQALELLQSGLSGFKRKSELLAQKKALEKLTQAMGYG